MTISCSFYDHVIYPASEFNGRNSDFIGNGVLHPATDFSLTFPNPFDMTFNIGSGAAWVNGYRIIYDANPVLTSMISQAHDTLNRIDLVEIGPSGVISGASYGTIQVVTGTPSASPAQPSPHSGFVPLYSVFVGAGITSITPSNITDLKAAVPLNLSGDPVSGLQATTKQYVDGQLSIYDPLGVVKEYYGTILPSRHLWADGKTIGDANSGATAGADVDMIDLYTVLWNAANINGSQIKLYDSTGNPASKGSNAVSDFNSHKRLSLPDKRGRVGIGADNMGGISANVVTNSNADILGGSGGEENHPLVVAEMPTHNHGGVTGNDSPDHTHHERLNGLDGGTQGSYISGTYYGGADQDSSPACYTDGANVRHTHSISNQGSNTAHNNMQPWIACNYIMRY